MLVYDVVLNSPCSPRSVSMLFMGDGYGQGAVARLKMLIQPARGS